MKLYLVRHAEAEPGDVDAERQLTEQGREDVRRLGAVLLRMDLSVGEVWHSGYPRAAQTAEPIARVVRTETVRAQEGLAPFDRTRPIAKLIRRRALDLMIVGHEPFLGKLAARLVTGRASRPVVTLDKPSIVCLSNSGDGAWCVEWMLSRDVTAALAAPQEYEPGAGIRAGDGPQDSDTNVT